MVVSSHPIIATSKNNNNDDNSNGNTIEVASHKSSNTNKPDPVFLLQSPCLSVSIYQPDPPGTDYDQDTYQSPSRYQQQKQLQSRVDDPPSQESGSVRFTPSVTSSKKRTGLREPPRYNQRSLTRKDPPPSPEKPLRYSIRQTYSSSGRSLAGSKASTYWSQGRASQPQIEKESRFIEEQKREIFFAIQDPPPSLSQQLHLLHKQSHKDPPPSPERLINHPRSGGSTIYTKSTRCERSLGCEDYTAHTSQNSNINNNYNNNNNRTIHIDLTATSFSDENPTLNDPPSKPSSVQPRNEVPLSPEFVFSVRTLSSTNSDPPAENSLRHNNSITDNSIHQHNSIDVEEYITQSNSQQDNQVNDEQEVTLQPYPLLNLQVETSTSAPLVKNLSSDPPASVVTEETESLDQDTDQPLLFFPVLNHSASSLSCDPRPQIISAASTPPSQDRNDSNQTYSAPKELCKPQSQEQQQEQPKPHFVTPTKQATREPQGTKEGSGQPWYIISPPSEEHSHSVITPLITAASPLFSAAGPFFNSLLNHETPEACNQEPPTTTTATAESWNCLVTPIYDRSKTHSLAFMSQQPIRQEDIDALRNRVDSVLHRLVQSSSNDGQRLRDQVAQLRQAPGPEVLRSVGTTSTTVSTVPSLLETDSSDQQSHDVNEVEQEILTTLLSSDDEDDKNTESNNKDKTPADGATKDQFGSVSSSNSDGKSTTTAVKSNITAPTTIASRQERESTIGSRTRDTSIGSRSVSSASSKSTGLDQRDVRDEWVVDPYGDQGSYTGRLNGENLPHGFGTMKYADGRTYTGEWIVGRWHGQGSAIFANGDQYEGMYQSDQRHGHGVYSWKDGRRYDGEFYLDQRQGKGTYTWPDGAEYNGEFYQGLRHGEGRYKFKDGSVYVGEWHKGKYHGVGECRWSDGRTYKGEWRRGKAHGYGLEIRPNGTIRHEGDWRDDHPVRNPTSTSSSSKIS